MNKFLRRTLIFFIPLFLYLIIVLAVDPYNYFSSEVVSSEIKKNIAFKLNYPLFKLLAYEKEPTKNIILGDSRSNNLDIDFVNSCGDKKFTNLAYGGGTLQEIINTFWEVSKNAKLETVVIGVNFNLYNKTNAMDRVSETISLKNNFVSYATSKYTFKSTGLIVKSILLNETYDVEIPEMSREEFWQYQLNSSANNTYRIYKYPENYFLELQQIAVYCKQNNIKLSFFIPPTHVSLQEKIDEFKLTAQEEKFKKDLMGLGPVYDFDFSNDITLNKDKFKDPYHCKESVAETIVKVVFCDSIPSDLSSYYKYYDIRNE